MVYCVQYRGAIGAENMHIQAECRGVNELTPSSTNTRELAPPKSDVPSVLLIQSIVAKYAKEYITTERIDSNVWHGMSRLLEWCRRGGGRSYAEV